MMLRYIIVSLVSGLLFGVMDGLINANPLAIKLYAVFQPIARTSINAPAGILIDLIYGFVLAGLFVLLFNGLPGKNGILKGLSFGLILWFLRVVMMSASQWMMFDLPSATLLYGLAAGLVEMVLLGIFYGLTLNPKT